jgi:hypothetical protein
LSGVATTTSALGVAAVGLCPESQQLGVAAERYCNHFEELQLLYYSCVAVLVHESSKFL